jgi:thiol-disulfide isomerase/thioredoxin
MKRLKTIIIFIIIANIVYSAQVTDFQLRNIENETVSYQELKGENLTVLDFWATWCVPCVRSIPELIKLSDGYKDQGVSFIGINVDGPRNLSKVKPFAKSLSIPYPVLLDVNGELLIQFNITGIPSLIIIDEKDKIVTVLEGFRSGDEEYIKKEIQKHLVKPEKTK